MPTGGTLLQGRPYVPACATDVRRWLPAAKEIRDAVPEVETPADDVGAACA